MAKRRTLDPTESAAALYGFKLRQHRDRKDWPQTALADRVDCSPDLISKIERAERTATARMSARFDEIFGTDGSFQELQPLAAREILPDWFRPFPKYEAAATILRVYELTLITGLLQTEEYMRELMQAEQPADKVDAMVAARLERQKILARERPPYLILAMDESSLGRTVGPPEVWRNQLLHLLEMAKRPNITLQVVTAGPGAYLGLSGPFTIITRKEESDAAYVEGAGFAQIIEEPVRVDEYHLRFDLIRTSALSANDSLKLIRTTLENV